MAYDQYGFKVVQAALTSLSRAHGFSVVGQTMSNNRDYKQELVDLGCKPKDLGTVTYNPLTHRVDVSGSVWLDHKGLDRLPFAFGEVGGSFECTDNRLTSLKGAPTEVGRGFACDHNMLTSLRFMPREINGEADIDADNIKDITPLTRCIIGRTLYLFGSSSAQDKVTKMLREHGYLGKIEYSD